LASLTVPGAWLLPAVAGSSLVFLAVLGAVAARTGGASMMTGAIRVLFWGAMAMLATEIVGKIFGTAIS